jgi:hypothetical protein
VHCEERDEVAAKLAAAERREAEKDARIAELANRMRTAEVTSGCLAQCADMLQVAGVSLDAEPRAVSGGAGARIARSIRRP